MKTLYHVTVLSNLARGFDKYSGKYSKAAIVESTYPDRFFLLERNDLGIGIEKASRLMARLGLEANRLIVLETQINPGALHANKRTGRGVYVDSGEVTLTGLHEVSVSNSSEFSLAPIAVEDAMADSLRILSRSLKPFDQISPRSVSILPVAIACQAKCPFCFSKASVSADQKPSKPDWDTVKGWLNFARAKGAERAVITGGGEPGILAGDTLCQLVTECARAFDKVVLISNGHSVSVLKAGRQIEHIKKLTDAGLKILALSRHHHDGTKNAALMNLDTPLETLVSVWRENRERWPHLRLRLVCVLQRGGIEDEQSLADYTSWAVDLGVEEICFKELYVSTSSESVYHDRAANDWSRSHQIPLSLVTRFFGSRGFPVQSRLPWGAPLFEGQWNGKRLRVAAYTEPSLFWERTHGVARSWNVMADGRCYASLEDRGSEIYLERIK